MEKIQREDALRCVSASRIASMEAVSVRARTPPVELIGEDHKAVYKIHSKENAYKMRRKAIQARDQTLCCRRGNAGSSLLQNVSELVR